MANLNRLNPGTLLNGFGGALRIAATVLLSPLLQTWYQKWGTHGNESVRILPGDELINQARSRITCGITIEDGADAVFPWLVQIGCQRAGWYSYDLLDNGGEKSAESILPEHQQLAVGDPVYATPDGKLSFPVVQVIPGKALVLGGTVDTKTGKGNPTRTEDMHSFFSGVMVFYLEEQAEQLTRLFFRQRLDWNPGFLNFLAYRVFLEPLSFVMVRKTLKTLK